MGVYIKGMEMPKNCAECCMRYDGQGYTWCIVTGESLSVEDMFSKRNEYCPLTELPPHGRLIDADELKNDMRDWNPSIIAVVDAMPTAIEAEGSEE